MRFPSVSEGPKFKIFASLRSAKLACDTLQCPMSGKITSFLDLLSGKIICFIISIHYNAYNILSDFTESNADVRIG